MNDSIKAIVTWLSDDATKAWIVAVTTAIGAILAWATKLKWAEEYKTVVEAKMALIEKNAELSAELAKEQAELAKKQIEFAEQKVKDLAEFTPGKIKEHFSGIRQIEEERIAILQTELEKAKQELIDKERMIAELKQQADLKTEEIEKFEKAKALLDKEITYIESQLSDLTEREEEIVQILGFMNRPDFPMETVKSVLSDFNSRKRWILSEYRARLMQEREQREEAKLAQTRTRRAYLEMQKREKKMSEMHQKMSFDEDQRG